MEQYNESIHFDKHFHEGIYGSIAFARANFNNGILTQHMFEEIEGDLLEVEKEWEADNFKIVQSDEGIHAAATTRKSIQMLMLERHSHCQRAQAWRDHWQVHCRKASHQTKPRRAGRLRNAPVAPRLEKHLINFFTVTADRAEKEIDYIMPGYIHLQRVQPVRWSHWMLSHAVVFADDLERLHEIIKRVNRKPLGWGALAGNPFNADREATSKELGFERLLWNSMAGVADRGFVTEFLTWGSILMQHVSRWSEDLIIYSSGEFDFVRLADAYSTGRILMPQKKNPDNLGSEWPCLWPDGRPHDDPEGSPQHL